MHMAVLEQSLHTVFINPVIYIDYGALLANLESDVLNPLFLYVCVHCSPLLVHFLNREPLHKLHCD